MCGQVVGQGYSISGSWWRVISLRVNLCCVGIGSGERLNNIGKPVVCLIFNRRPAVCGGRTLQFQEAVGGSYIF